MANKEFKVGDWVRIKPEHRHYEKQHHKTHGELFQIASISHFKKGDLCATFTGGFGAYVYRLQHDVFMTAVRAVIQNNQQQKESNESD